MSSKSIRGEVLRIRRALTVRFGGLSPSTLLPEIDSPKSQAAQVINVAGTIDFTWSARVASLMQSGCRPPKAHQQLIGEVVAAHRLAKVAALRSVKMSSEQHRPTVGAVSGTRRSGTPSVVPGLRPAVADVSVNATANAARAFGPGSGREPGRLSESGFAKPTQCSPPRRSSAIQAARSARAIRVRLHVGNPRDSRSHLVAGQPAVGGRSWVVTDDKQYFPAKVAGTVFQPGPQSRSCSNQRN